jgi:isochorismate hydrolase
MSMAREVYFTAQGLKFKAREMLQQMAEAPRHSLQRYVPEHSALLVLDMQSFFLKPESHAFVPSAVAIVPGIQALMQAYARRGLPVFFTQHLNTSQNAGLMGIWWRDVITAQNPLSEIVADMDLSAGHLISKSQYDAFYATCLEGSLREKCVSQVVICGVMTHLCCESTARSAFIRGFEVFFAVDGTATYNEAFHRASLLNLAHGFANLVLVDDLLNALREEHAD